jgi:lambda family phage portal protein
MTVRAPRSGRSSDSRVIIDREMGTYTSLGYRAVRVASAEGRSYVSVPGSTHDERDRENLIRQSRDFMRNNAIYKGLIERMVNYIVGNGFELQVTGPGDNMVKKIEGFWRNWFRRPEIRGLLSGAAVSKMVMRELLVAGDVSVLKTNTGKIQLFEAEQLDGGNGYKNGILKDKNGAPKKFHLCPWNAYKVDKKNGESRPAEEVLFLTNPERPSQLRGIPASQASFPMLHRINDICDAEAIAWQLLSRMAVSIIREQGPDIAYEESREDPTKSSDELEGDLATRMTELDYALIFHGNPNEKIEGVERTVPGKNFPESIRMFLRLLGLPIGCPLELVLLDWTNSNYSQSRAVLEQAYQNFVSWQSLLIDFFYRPLFEWRLGIWRAAGLIGKKVSMDAGWIPPVFPWIDQLKEAQAQAAKVERGFTTHAEICKSLSSDRSEIVAQRVREVRDAIIQAAAISDETGVEVPWQIFCGLQPPKTAEPASDGGQQQDNSNSNASDGDESEDDADV